ncbi:hypothetical protein [Gordonia sp. 4N]|uniref:hypothetical protein n=1 Tax=Gordonia sp. 4N TaxID=2993508 RepID=UPI0022493F3E|nr:hypothetical protein [Gordonia sp. 4N]MCX2754080.1 hypothetical protein [Gordonia sp. 4N]
MDVALLIAAAAAAGWVDAVVGGGGLVLIPAMLIAQPGLPIDGMRALGPKASSCKHIVGCCC